MRTPSMPLVGYSKGLHAFGRWGTFKPSSLRKHGRNAGFTPIQKGVLRSMPLVFFEIEISSALGFVVILP